MRRIHTPINKYKGIESLCTGIGAKKNIKYLLYLNNQLNVYNINKLN